MVSYYPRVRIRDIYRRKVIRFSLFLLIILVAGVNAVIAEEVYESFRYSGYGHLSENPYIGSNVKSAGSEEGYVHHSCSKWKCYKDCIVEKFDKDPDYKDMLDLPSTALDLARECLCKPEKICKAGKDFEDAYKAAKASKCAYKCTSQSGSPADSTKSREYWECTRCAIAWSGDKIPGAGCVIELWNKLGDYLVPHSDCIAECLDPKTASKKWGQQCRDHRDGDKLGCVNEVNSIDGSVSGYIAEFTCKDCEWRVTDIKKFCYAKTESGISIASPCVETSNGPKCIEDEDDLPKPPGGDYPDDNHDFSSLYVQTNNLYVQANNQNASSEGIPEIAVLYRGIPLIVSLLNETNESFIPVGPSYLKIINSKDFPVFIIPTGGLYGLDSSPAFRSWLEDYVDSGGTLVVFTQQHGYEFLALPGGELAGYGWLEDQSCQFGSVAISAYHPIFSGQDSSVLDANVDGFFTSYPENATVLLTRTKNGQPAMLMYEYGNGTVLATTLYSDMASGLHQGTSAEKKLVRDIVRWAKKPEEVKSYSPGIVNISINVTNYYYIGPLEYPVLEFDSEDLINVPVNVTNSGNVSIDKVSFVLFNPDFNSTWINVTESIQVNESKLVNLTYQSTNSTKSGIWGILYFLFSGNDTVSARWGGEFALNYNITNLSRYDAIVTIRDPDGDKVLENYSSGYSRPGETERINLTFNSNSSQLGMWSARYSVLTKGGKVLASDLKPFAVSNFRENAGGFTYQGSELTFSVTSDNEYYVYGSSAIFTFHLWNNGGEDKNVTVTWGLVHHGSKGIIPLGWDDALNKSIVVPAKGNASFNYILPKVVDLDRLRAKFYVDENHVGSAEKGIWMFKPDIDIDVKTDKQQYFREENVSMYINLSNLKGEVYSRCSGPGSYIGTKGYVSGCEIYMRPVPVNDTTITVRVLNSNNLKIFEDTFSMDFPANYRGNKTYEFSVPADSKPGLYFVSIEVYKYGNLIGHNTTYFEIVRIPLKLEFDKQKYRIRQNLGMNITLYNKLLDGINLNFNISIPDFWNVSQSVELGAGESKQTEYNLTLPETLKAGKHKVLVAKYEDKFTEEFNFFVTESKLRYSLEKECSAGQNVSVKLENTGGVDADYTYSAILQDPYLSTIFEENRMGVIKAGETVIINHTLPEGAINGTYFLSLNVENVDMNETLSSIELINVEGMDALLSSRTDKKIYSGEDITILTNITKLNGELDGAVLNLKILSYQPPPPPEPCVVPTDDLYIDSDTTLCPGVYNIPDAGQKGVIII
jgi:hypothetical protein